MTKKKKTKARVARNGSAAGAHGSPPHAPLRVETVTLASLALDPHNARRHPERNLEAIQASLKRFGQQKPVVVDADGKIVAGNGTVAGALALGWKSIDIVRTELRGPEARAFAIADNRTGELAEWDAAELQRQLDELEAEGFDLERELAFTDAEVDELLKDVDDDGTVTGKSTTTVVGASASGGGGSVADQFKIVLKLRDEMHQTDLLDALDHNDGSPAGAKRLADLLKDVECRALVG